MSANAKSEVLSPAYIEAAEAEIARRRRAVGLPDVDLRHPVEKIDGHLIDEKKRELRKIMARGINPGVYVAGDAAPLNVLDALVSEGKRIADRVDSARINITNPAVANVLRTPARLAPQPPAPPPAVDFLQAIRNNPAPYALGAGAIGLGIWGIIRMIRTSKKKEKTS